MKTILRVMTLCVLLIGFQSCSDDDNNTPLPSLEVNYANIAGTWMLAEWNNGEPVPEGTYCYIYFDRRDKVFKMYQKFDSMYAKCITGEYSIEEDVYLGYIIDGEYDYGNGDWNNSYIVTNLYEFSMVWTAKNDKSNVCKYVRCDEIPQDVIDEARVIE